MPKRRRRSALPAQSIKDASTLLLMVYARNVRYANQAQVRQMMTIRRDCILAARLSALALLERLYTLRVHRMFGGPKPIAFWQRSSIQGTGSGFGAGLRDADNLSAPAPTVEDNRWEGK